MIPATRKATPAPASAKNVQDQDFVLPVERFDDVTIVDLETNDPDDTVKTKLAKRIFLRMIWDLTPKPESTTSRGLFGQASTSSQSKQDRLDGHQRYGPASLGFQSGDRYTICSHPAP